MCADGGADCHEEGHEPKAIGLLTFVQVAVEEQVGEVALIPAPQVHQKEGDIIQDIDRRERVVELDAVEQGRRTVEQANIAQDEIAMTSPDLSRLAPSLEKVGVPLEAMPERLRKDLRVFSRDEGRSAQRLVVDLEHRRNASSPPMIEADDSIAMEGRDPPGEICYQRRRERSS